MDSIICMTPTPLPVLVLKTIKMSLKLVNKPKRCSYYVFSPRSTQALLFYAAALIRDHFWTLNDC